MRATPSRRSTSGCSPRPTGSGTCSRSRTTAATCRRSRSSAARGRRGRCAPSSPWRRSGGRSSRRCPTCSSATSDAARSSASSERCCGRSRCCSCPCRPSSPSSTARTSSPTRPRSASRPPSGRAWRCPSSACPGSRCPQACTAACRSASSSSVRASARTSCSTPARSSSSAPACPHRSGSAWGSPPRRRLCAWPVRACAVSRGAEADRARLEAILESSSSIIVALDTRYRLTELNGAARRILGLGDEDIGRYLGDIIDPRRTADTPERREELLSILDGASATFDTFLLAPDGTERTIDFTLAPIRGPDGAVAGISAIGRDVTGERRDEEQRRNLAAVVESAHDPIVAARPDGTVLSWNRAAEVAFGARVADVLGRPLMEVLPDWLGGAELALEERVTRGEAIADVEVATTGADGAQTHHAVSAFPVQDEHGELAATALIVRDVTEAKGLAEQLGRAQRLESLGRLAGGIAHDFNNLMAVITGYAGVLAREVQGESSVHAVEEVQRAARRAAELTSQLLAFSRQRPAAPTTVDVAETVVGVRAMLERLLGAELELIVRAEADVVPVVADRGQLEQVVVNLAINARDAMPDGG